MTDPILARPALVTAKESFEWINMNMNTIISIMLH
jgi:hypothetical protein